MNKGQLVIIFFTVRGFSCFKIHLHFELSSTKSTMPHYLTLWTVADSFCIECYCFKIEKKYRMQLRANTWNKLELLWVIAWDHDEFTVCEAPLWCGFNALKKLRVHLPSVKHPKGKTHWSGRDLSWQALLCSQWRVRNACSLGELAQFKLTQAL